MIVLVGLGNPGEKYAKNRHNVGFMYLDFLCSHASTILKSWKFDKYLNAEKAEIAIQSDRSSGIQRVTESGSQGVRESDVQSDRATDAQGIRDSGNQSDAKAQHPRPITYHLSPITYNPKPTTYHLSATLLKPQTFMNRSGESLVKYGNTHNLKPNTYNLSPITYIVAHDDLDLRLGNFKIQKSVGPKVHNGIASIEQSLGTKDFWRIRIGVDNREHPIAGEEYVLSNFSSEEMAILSEVFEKISKSLVMRLHEEKMI